MTNSIKNNVNQGVGLPAWAIRTPTVAAPPAVDVPVSRTRFGFAAPTPTDDPQARAAPQAGAEGAVASAATSVDATTASKTKPAPPNIARCSKCKSPRVIWIDAYHRRKCAWCEPPTAATTVKEVWCDLTDDFNFDPDDLWGEPTSAEPSTRTWTRLDVPKDVVGGLSVVGGCGAKWDGVWWCEVVDGNEIHHRLGLIDEFLYDRPK